MDIKLRRTAADLTLAALTIFGAVLLLIGAMSLPPPRFEPLGSAALPRILAGLMIVFAVIIALRALLRHRSPDFSPEPATGTQPDTRKGAFVLAALVAYVFALETLRVPFIFATPVFVAATGLVIGARTWRNFVIFLFLGACLAGMISLVLERFLFVRIG